MQLQRVAAVETAAASCLWGTAAPLGLQLLHLDVCWVVWLVMGCKDAERGPTTPQIKTAGTVGAEIGEKRGCKEE